MIIDRASQKVASLANIDKKGDDAGSIVIFSAMIMDLPRIKPNQPRSDRQGRQDDQPSFRAEGAPGPERRASNMDLDQ